MSYTKKPTDSVTWKLDNDDSSESCIEVLKTKRRHSVHVWSSCAGAPYVIHGVIKIRAWLFSNRSPPVEVLDTY